MSTKPSLPSISQRGVVSIMVTMVMMIVISLIVLGVAQVARREQEQAANNQLSMEAYYAAESGVNDVWGVINAAVQSGQSITPQNTCQLGGPYANLNQTISGNNNVSYSCLLVDPTPGSLSQDNLGNTPAVFTLKPASGNPLNNVTFTWDKATGASGDSSSCPDAGTIPGDGQPAGVFAPQSQDSPWACPYGVLRVDLVPGNDLTRDGLINNTTTLFLVPSKNATDGQIGGNEQKGAKYAAVCDDSTSTCQFTISGLGQALYYARVSQIYQSSRLTITGNDGRAKFADSQVQIDVTGKAQDVLRRIRVAVTISGGNQNAGAGVALGSGDSLCKRFATYDGYFGDFTSAYSQCQQ